VGNTVMTADEQMAKLAAGRRNRARDLGRRLIRPSLARQLSSESLRAGEFRAAEALGNPEIQNTLDRR
jgi:hypothetical protein